MSMTMNDDRRLDTTLDGSEAQWTHVSRWKHDAQGVIYPPAWPQAEVTFVAGYSYEQGQEDYAFFTGTTLADVELTVAFKMYAGSVNNVGVVFRAVDSARCYVVDIEDMCRKGQQYRLTLWLQDETGYRRELAGGFWAHSVVSPDIYQIGPVTFQGWLQSSPQWAELQVRAAGSHIDVAVDGQTIFTAEDDTYAAGCVGLVARGPVLFRDLRVKGARCEPSEPWKRHKGQLPRFFYPGDSQCARIEELNAHGPVFLTEGFNAFPTVAAWGETVFVAWQFGLRSFPPDMMILTRSDDNGRTWTPPERISYPLAVGPLFVHDDGRLRCFVGIPRQDESRQEYGFIISPDGGATWSGPAAFQPGGRKLSHWGPIYPYSPITRLSDGTLVMTGYEGETIPGGSEERNDERLDRSVLFRSTDDGGTWSAPIYFDKENFDHNECMVAETAPGKLVAFMRTLRAPHMWTSTSNDGGLTWTKLAQSNVSGECPYLLAHSSGALVLFSRGSGSFIKLSFDQGRSWTKEYRISPASAMIGMAELADGTVFIAMHEGYRRGQYIRGQRFRVTARGPVAAP